jgi:hypothetical protein
MLDFFHFSKDGRHYRRVVQAFQRVFATTIFFGIDDQPDGHPLADSARFHFFDKLHLWFHDHDKLLAANQAAENTIIYHPGGQSSDRRLAGQFDSNREVQT